jgi:hypothetical protein
MIEGIQVVVQGGGIAMATCLIVPREEESKGTSRVSPEATMRINGEEDEGGGLTSTAV